jgi:hypothetical protein
VAYWLTLPALQLLLVAVLSRSMDCQITHL